MEYEGGQFSITRVATPLQQGVLGCLRQLVKFDHFCLASRRLECVRWMSHLSSEVLACSLDVTSHAWNAWMTPSSFQPEIIVNTEVFQLGT